MRVALACYSFLCLLAAAPAFADHPRLEQARERFRAADLPGALESLSAAEQASDLSREDLLAVLELRTLIQLALGRSEPAEETLRQIASVDPGHRFGPEAPPDVVERFSAIVASQRGPVGVAVDRRETADGVVLAPSATNDPEGMVRAARVHARVDGGAWERAENAPLTVGAPAGSRVEWYAVAVGPGGAAVATQGSAESPMSFRLGSDPLAPPDDDDGGPSGWVWFGVGAGAVAVAAVVTVLVVGASSGEPNTVVDGPSGWP